MRVNLRLKSVARAGRLKPTPVSPGRATRADLEIQAFRNPPKVSRTLPPGCRADWLANATRWGHDGDAGIRARLN